MRYVKKNGIWYEKNHAGTLFLIHGDQRRAECKDGSIFNFSGTGLMGCYKDVKNFGGFDLSIYLSGVLNSGISYELY